MICIIPFFINIKGSLMKKIYGMIFVAVILLFTGCSRYDVNNISSNPKYQEKLTDLLFISKSSSTKIRYHKGHNNLEKCKVKYKKLQDFVLSENTILEQLKEREVKLNYMGEGDHPKRLLVLSPVELHSSDFLMCDAKDFTISISLYDFEKISKEWDGKRKHEKVKDLTNLSNDILIYKKLYTARFETKPYNHNEINNALMNWKDSLITVEREKEKINDLYTRIIKDLEFLELIPQKTVSKKENNI